MDHRVLEQPEHVLRAQRRLRHPQQARERLAAEPRVRLADRGAQRGDDVRVLAQRGPARRQRARVPRPAHLDDAREPPAEIRMVLRRAFPHLMDLQHERQAAVACLGHLDEQVEHLAVIDGHHHEHERGQIVPAHVRRLAVPRHQPEEAHGLARVSIHPRQGQRVLAGLLQQARRRRRLLVRRGQRPRARDLLGQRRAALHRAAHQLAVGRRIHGRRGSCRLGRWWLRQRHAPRKPPRHLLVEHVVLRHPAPPPPSP
ncbi:MAG: hypothetical protein QM820_28540 [Minicystis sp.]